MSDNLDPIMSNDPSKIEVTEVVLEKDERPTPVQEESENVPHGTQEEGEQNEDDASTPQEEPKETTLENLPLPGDEVTDPKKSLPKWVEKKLSRKEAELKQKEAELEHYKQQQALQQDANIPARVAEFIARDPEAPKKENFGSEGEYIAAMVTHTNRRNGEFAAQQAQVRSMQEGENKFQTSLKQKLSEGEEKYADFKEKVTPLFSPGFPPNRAMAEAINDSTHTSDILYFLGEYRDEAEKIARMNPIQAVKEIAKLEIRFNNRKSPQVTKAPPVIASITSNQGKKQEVDNVEKLIQNSEKMSQAEFEKAYARIASQTKSAW